jgi:hypothetical protein
MRKYYEIIMSVSIVKSFIEIEQHAFLTNYLWVIVAETYLQSLKYL